MKLQKKIIANFQKCNLEFTKVKLLLAVSGGKDSMMLLHLLKNANIYFEVAHMNYQLREEDSHLDEKLVREVCSDLGIVWHVKSVDTKLFCQENNLGTQEGARILRYNWFEELLVSQKLDFITTAHHASDNVETFMQNLKRGSGLRGLKSMVLLQSNRLKPMLDFTRNEIDTYVNDNNVSFRQDASNNQNHYQRNIIRNQVLPFIEEHMPGFNHGAGESIFKLQSDYDYLEKALEQDAQKVISIKGSDTIIENFRTIHPRLLFYILEKFHFNEAQSQDILGALHGGKIIVNDGYEALVHQQDLYITAVKSFESTDILLSGVGEYIFENEVLKIQNAEIPSVFSLEKNVCWMDGDNLEFPLRLRNWQLGDKFQPLGMKGSKMVSDFLTDLKIPLHHKRNVKVLISNGKIVWVVNYGISDQVKITQNSKNVLKIETIELSNS